MNFHLKDDLRMEFIMQEGAHTSFALHIWPISYNHGSRTI